MMSESGDRSKTQPDGVLEVSRIDLRQLLRVATIPTNMDRRGGWETALLQSMWGVELVGTKRDNLKAYFQHWEEQGISTDTGVGILAVVTLLRNNPSESRAALQAAIIDFRRRKTRAHAPYEEGIAEGIDPLGNGEVLMSSSVPADRLLATAVELMFGMSLAINVSAVARHSITFWEESKSIKDIIESVFPRIGSVEVNNERQWSRTVTPIQRHKLRARYLKEHADVELQWTKHLPDHLELDGKVLQIFELPSLLEAAHRVVDGRAVGLEQSLKKYSPQPLRFRNAC